jgi:hypothetical protein
VGDSEFSADRLFNRNGLWDRGLIGAIRSKKEQQGSEDNRTHADLRDDVDGVVAMRHSDLLWTAGNQAHGWRITRFLARVA